MNRREFLKFTGSVTIGAALPAPLIKAAEQIAAVSSGGPLEMAALQVFVTDWGETDKRVILTFDNDFKVTKVRDATPEDNIPPVVPFRSRYA